MKKRLIIGAIVVAVIGVVAYTFLVPRKGTGEYHKKEYAAWQNGRLSSLIRPFPWFVERWYLQHRENQLRFHGEALRRAGYTTILTVLRE